MNIMHNKTVTVKFNVTWRNGERRNTNKQSIYNSKYLCHPPKLDKFQLQCYSKCSKWRPLVSKQQRRRLRHW